MNVRTLVPIGLLLVLSSCGGERAASVPAPGGGTPAAEPTTPTSAMPDTLAADTIMPRDTAQP
jgi:hypothetical protein